MKRSLFTKLNLHFLVMGVVLAFDIFMGVRFALAWREIRSDQSSAFVAQQIHYGQLRAQMQHLNDLPKKVDIAGDDAQKFYDARIAPNYSTVVAQLDGTMEKTNVRLAHSAYGQQPAIPGLTEVLIDAGLSGQYTDMMHFINDLERDRDHVFFIIDGVTFTGEQGGVVNLRLRLRTYLRSNAPDLPPITTQNGPANSASAAPPANPSPAEEKP
jgi:type IV pilus assembly protein PilO